MSDYSTAKLAAELEAQQLAIHETSYSTCPLCGGKKKFSVTRLAHTVLWNCFRAACPAKGMTHTSGLLIPASKPKPRSKLKPFRGAFHALSNEAYDWLRTRFPWLDGVNLCTALKQDDVGRIMLPVNNPHGWERGYIARAYEFSEWDGPKAVVYMHADGPVMGWYPVSDCGTLVLVEDSMSAWACQLAGLSACALIGTHLNNDKVREIATQRPREVIIALDADATDQAFGLARKWGLAFNKTRVAVLERDLKDEHDLHDIPEVLGIESK